MPRVKRGSQTAIALDEQARLDRARRAATKARELKPRWVSFARVITRNPQIKLEFSADRSETDGKTIWCKIPISLGDEIPHNRSLCGYRNNTSLKLLCPACRSIEEFEGGLYHEIAHIAFDTFAPLSDTDKVDALWTGLDLEARNAPDGSRANKIKALWEKHPPQNFTMASRLISRWMGVLVNCAEDGRVNRAMVEARPGTRPMFVARVTSTFTEGIKNFDGSVSHWRDGDLNMQALIAVFCSVSNVDYTDYLAPEVVEPLQGSAQFNALMEPLRRARSARTVFVHCVPVLEELRRLGFCLSPEDQEDEQQQNDEQQQPDQKDSGSGKVSGSGSGAGHDDHEDQQSEPNSEQHDDQPTQPDEKEQDGSTDNKEKPTSGGTGIDSAPVPEDTNGDNDDDGTSPEEAGSDDGDSDRVDQAEPDRGNDGDSGDDREPDQEPSPDSGEGSKTDPTRAVELDIKQFLHHAEGDDAGEGEEGSEVSVVGAGESESPAEEGAVAIALVQAEHFDSTSYNVAGVVIHKWGEKHEAYGAWSRARFNQPIEVSEPILSRALGHLRIAFSANKRTHFNRDLTSGRINGRVLGRRVPTGDDRLFQKKTRPGKRDYFVCLGGDVSGSTASGAIHLLKEALYAQAELLHRLGIRFAVYAHTGGSGYNEMNVDIYEIKAADEVWNNECRERLFALGPSAANLDGHTMEFYRKVCDRERTTDKVIMYYTDGAMPLENYDEELEILQREIKICKQKNISLVGVGIGNDDPAEHGLDTIRIDDIGDVPKVVTELEKRLN